MSFSGPGGDDSDDPNQTKRIVFHDTKSFERDSETGIKQKKKHGGSI